MRQKPQNSSKWAKDLGLGASAPSRLAEAETCGRVLGKTRNGSPKKTWNPNERLDRRKPSVGLQFYENERANRDRCRPPAKFVRGHQSTMSLALWGLLHCGVSCTVNLLISGLLKGCVTQSSERQTAPLPLFTGSKTYMEQNGQKAVAGSWQPLPVGHSLR